MSVSRLLSGFWPIILILSAAAILRLDNITQPFIDDNAWREASVAMMAENFYRKSWNIFYPEVNWVGPGPGYQGREFQTVSYTAALLYTVLDQKDWVGRCVVLTFGLWGIFALYQLIRRVWGEHRALAAAALMAIFPSVIRIDRSFLPDSAMASLIVTSFWMLILYLQTDRLRYLILATLVGILGNLTKIPGMIVGLPMLYAAISILGRRRALSPRKMAPLVIAGVLSALPVAAYYLWARHLAHTYPPYHFAGEGNWLWDQGLSQWIKQRYFISPLWGRLTAMWTLPGIALLSLGVLLPVIRKPGSEAAREREAGGRPDEAPWLFHWWLAAGLIYYLIGARELVENPSNFQIISPAVAALSADAVIALSLFAARQLRLPAMRVAVAVALVVFTGVWGQRRSRLHSSYARQSYELGLVLRRVSQQNDLVVTLGDLIGCPSMIYYSGRRGWLFPPFEDIRDWEQLPEDDEAIKSFENLRAQGAAWLGVVSRQRDETWKTRPRFARYVEETCELKQADENGIIYRVLTPEEMAALSIRR
jgi:4-amino-4-deoxy-L-arabinose transferase-like glycosyltransferase